MNAILDIFVRKLDVWALKYPRRTVALMAMAAVVVCVVANGR
jgi:hypothetical protein